MVKELRQAQTSIGRVMVRYKGTVDDMNRPTLRLRTERLLRSVDLQPPGLPPGMLLIVQKVYALHGSAPLSSSASLQVQWSKHLRTEMERLYRTAARPALHPVPSNATSVLFADAAEMLACLTRDLLNGRAWQQWYWQQMLRHIPRVPHAPGPALAAIWSEQAAFVPAMAGSLKLEEVCAAIALLSVAEASQVIAALNRSFDLPSPVPTSLKITSVQSPNSAPDALLSDISALKQPSDISASVQLSEEYVPALPPWQRWLSPLPVTALTALTPQAQYLLGLIATLHYAPAFARSTRFMAQAVTWLNTEMHSGTSSENRENRENALQTYVANSTPESLLVKDTMPPSLAQQARTTNSFPESHPAKNTMRSSTAQETQTENSSPGTPITAVANLLGNDTPDDVVFGAAQPFPAEGVLTALGGVLYLIHLLKWLNLPASWAESEMLAEYLSSWGMVELLAYGLLGEMSERYTDDPLWDVLAMLDKREPGSAIGADLPPQTSFRLPAKWLVRYGTYHPVWVAMTDGLRLYLLDEEARYLIVDVPLEERSIEEGIAAEVEAYRAQRVDAACQRWEMDDVREEFIAPWWRWERSVPLIVSRSRSASKEGGIHYPPTRVHLHAYWWLERVIGFVRSLLVRVLNDPAIAADTLPEALLCKRGRLVAGRTHVDLYMTMDQISLPIRRAGLDCDPSWVPDLGRIVLFHFGEET